MNQNIINLFELLINHIKVQIDNSSNKKDNIKHSFRLRQISNALKFIKKFPDEIKSSDQLKNIKGFGEGILNRIDQILKTNNLKELDQNNQTNINQKLIDQLDKIVGVGRKTALKLIDKYSLNSIEDLIKLYLDDPKKIQKLIDETKDNS
jgi:DNA polymerase/3'-5' exonuclease PolX